MQSCSSLHSRAIATLRFSQLSKSILIWKLLYLQYVLNMLFTYFWVTYNIVKLQTCISWHSWAIATLMLLLLSKWVVTWKLLHLQYFIMSTPLGGGYIIFAFFAVRCPMSDVRCPMSDVRRPMSGVTHGFRSFKGKVLELLSPNLVCRLIGSVACLGLLLAVVPLLLTE